MVFLLVVLHKCLLAMWLCAFHRPHGNAALLQTINLLQTLLLLWPEELQQASTYILTQFGLATVPTCVPIIRLVPCPTNTRNHTHLQPPCKVFCLEAPFFVAASPLQVLPSPPSFSLIHVVFHSYCCRLLNTSYTQP